MSLTLAEIRAAIAASPELTALAQAGDTQAIADALSAGRTKPRKTEIGTGTILAAFQGLGGQFIDTLQTIGETDRDVHWLLVGTILRGVLDTGDTATRAGIQRMIDTPAMAPFVPGMQALLALGVQDDPITRDEVESAILDGWTGSQWSGAVTGTEIRNGMVYVTITYTSSVQGVQPRVETPFGDDLTPGRVQGIIAARCESFRRADAALALFGA